MKIVCLTLSLVFAGMLMSCGDNDLLDDYQVNKPRALAIKVEDPEARPGDPLALTFLVGGKAIDQSMPTEVTWFFLSEQPVMVGASPYDQVFVTQLPADLLDTDTQWLDLTILAQIEVDSMTLTAEKEMRITRNPIGKNPVIDSVQLNFLDDNQVDSSQVFNGEQFSVSSEVKNIAFTAVTDILAPGENERLVFRWHVASSKNSGGKLYVNDNKDVAKQLLGPGVPAAETKASAVFSLRGEDEDGTMQTGVYDIYLVVRDNARNPQSDADDRFGTDFFYFTLCVNSDC